MMNSFTAKTWFLMAAVAGWLLLNTPVAQAHKVSLFAWVEDGQVHTESKFSGGKRVKGGKIKVYDHKGEKVLEGISDDQGYFAFPVPQGAHTLKIELVSGMGHGNHWLVSAQELGAASTPQTDAPPSTTTQIKEANTGYASMEMNAAMVEQIVEKALDKKLAPIKAQMAEQSWGVRDIVGGLGYIFGLMGLASFVRYRKQQRPKPSA